MKIIKELINKIYFRPAWYSILINPIFITRRLLYNNIKLFARGDFSNKKILDVGCGIKPYKDLFKDYAEYIGVDIEGGGHLDKYKDVDKFYDGSTLPFADKIFDVVICTQVLEHVISPLKLLREIARTLKSGGQVYITMPFVWNEHEVPYDFNRFTRYEHDRILKEAGLSLKSIKPTCGVFRTCGQMISGFVFEKLSSKNGLLNSLIAFIFCFPIQLIFICLDFIFKNHWLTLDYIVRAEKL